MWRFISRSLLVVKRFLHHGVRCFISSHSIANASSLFLYVVQHQPHFVTIVRTLEQAIKTSPYIKTSRGEFGAREYFYVRTYFVNPII